MDNVDFSNYCSSFLKDTSLGDLIFYKDQDQSYSYRDLMLSVSWQVEQNTNSFSALKITSSYQLFIHLIAGSITQKKILIISDKEPSAAVIDYQKRLGFKDAIIDGDINKSSTLMTRNFNIDVKRPAFFILSSGSSAPSKAIGLSLSNVYHSAKSIIDFFDMTSSDCTYLNLPHHHIGGLMILWRAFLVKALSQKMNLINTNLSR